MSTVDKGEIKLIVSFPTPATGLSILALARENKWRIYNDATRIETGWQAIVFNWAGYDPGTVIWTSNIADLMRRSPEHKLFNAATEWDKLVEILSGEPEFDETPLPYDMPPEQQEELRKKFNLSQEQWDYMPLQVREAMAGVQNVSVVENRIVEAKWFPISEPPKGSPTVLFTKDPNHPANSVRDAALGYFSADRPSIVYGESTDPDDYSHWCHMPGSINSNHNDDSEDDDEGDTE